MDDNPHDATCIELALPNQIALLPHPRAENFSLLKLPWRFTTRHTQGEATAWPRTTIETELFGGGDFICRRRIQE